MFALKAPRDMLLPALLAAAGVVERRNLKPILSCLLLEQLEELLRITATDLDTQIVVDQPMASINLSQGKVAVSARKLIEILKALPEGSDVELVEEKERLHIRAGRSRFVLQTLPAEEFPLFPELEEKAGFSISERALRRLFALSSFAMAQQDVRHYLNGLYLHTKGAELHAAATDSHRLAHVSELFSQPLTAQEAIVPRKAVLGLERLLSDKDEPVEVLIGERQIVFKLSRIRFSTKTIEGRFPDYQRVIPQNHPILIAFDRIELLRALQRVSLLAEEKMQGVKLALSSGILRLHGHNTEHEEAQEELEITYEGAPLEIGFNVQYLIEVLTSLTDEVIHVHLKDAMSAALITTPNDERFSYVVMPMRL